MSARGLVHNDMFIFDGTNYDIWKNRMLIHFRDMDPNLERIVDIGFSPPMDFKNLSSEDEKNLYLDAQASNVLVNALSYVVTSSIIPFWSAHELWTKLQDKYVVSNIIEDDCVASTSGKDEFSSSTTSPTCDFSQGNDMVSGDRNCNMDSVFTICNPSYLSSCNDLSLDLNTSSTQNSSHACVNSPCISCRNDLNKSHDDMLVLSCCHDKNASISSSACVANHVEETKDSMGQDMVLNEATNAISSSHSSGTHLCLMARDSKVTPTLEPITSCDEEDVDNVEEEIDIDDLYEKGEIVYRALVKKDIACSNFVEILDFAIKRKQHIDKLEAQIVEHENTIDKMSSFEHEYANQIAHLNEALEKEQTTKESLEEAFALELSRVRKSHDREFEVASALQIKNDELEVAYAKLLEDFEHLNNGSRVIKGELIKLTELHEQLKASYSKELSKLPSPLDNNDACATNSISCEAST